MPRIELWMTVFAGVAGGLAGVLWSGMITAHWLARADRGRAMPTRTETAARLFAGAALRAGSGAALGFLFWLGWGLIAVVGAPWYATGLLYGLLCWASLAVPVLGTWLLASHGPPAAAPCRPAPRPRRDCSPVPPSVRPPVPRSASCSGWAGA